MPITTTPDTTDAEASVAAEPPRFLMRATAPDFMRAMLELDRTAAAGLDPIISELVRARASQLNDCAYCVDKHSTAALERGEREHRLLLLPTWRSTSFFTARERAALALVEAITLLPRAGVPDEVYDAAAGAFDAEELTRLIAMCVTINAWNRIGVTARMSPPARDR